MSNFLEQELRKLFGDGEIIQNPKFMGRVCMGTLDGGLRVRADFVTMGTADHYEGLQLTVLNRVDGPIDRIILRFRDVLGKKKVPNSSYFRDGIYPYIWGNGEWYAYQPTTADYQTLRQAAGDYLDIFREQIREREPPSPARKSPGRSASKKARSER